MVNSGARGRAGEDRAVQYLRTQGYRILERNLRSRRGEVDIVCVAPGRVVFVEVKSWRRYGRESLAHSIGALKRRRIIGVARWYLQAHRELESRTVRFDVVLAPEGAAIEHIEGAFDSEWPE